MVAGADYDTQVIRPGRNKGWRKQLSQKMNEWEDELPNPNRNSGELCVEAQDEAVTSFMSEDGEEGEEVDPPFEAVQLDRSKSTEEEIREKVEGSMKDKIRDWKNMTADAATGKPLFGRLEMCIMSVTASGCGNVC